MIVDDWKVIIGSANINDWSMLGTWDSEIACLIEDKSLIDIKLGDETFWVGKFAHEFRKELFKEHFGMEVIDPINEKWDELWKWAKVNTKEYWWLFFCEPDDS